MIHVDPHNQGSDFFFPNCLQRPSGPGFLKEISPQDAENRPGKDEIVEKNIKNKNLKEVWFGNILEKNKKRDDT
jgi:hypothetical protein